MTGASDAAPFRLIESGELGVHFFRPDELLLVASLVDLILPADSRSGGAILAQVPDFLDQYLQGASPSARERMRLGLAWLDATCRRKCGQRWITASEINRRAVIDMICAPVGTHEVHSQIRTFFVWLLRLTTFAFWTSDVGAADLGYNVRELLPNWTGCSTEALAHVELMFTESPREIRPTPSPDEPRGKTS